MTQEEKARAYDEALETARKINSGEGVTAPPDWTIYKVIFPELKESEGERIRKSIMNLVIENIDQGIMNYNNVDCDDMINWLERQGEVKSIDNLEPKFKVGDWIIFAESHNSVYQVEQIDSCRYYLRHYLGSTLSVHFDNELIRQWTIQDAKDGDVLCYETKNECRIFIYKNGYIHYHCCYYNGCLTTIDSFFVIQKHLLSYIHPATKEERDLLFQKIKEAGYELDEENKKPKKIEQKDSIEERIEWKPSQEQMKALHDLNLTGDISYAGQAQVLIELYNDLKKLIE